MSECPFCEAQTFSRRLGTVCAIRDQYPVTTGHTLVMPFAHRPDYFSLTEDELRDASRLLRVLAEEMAQSDPTIRGFNIGTNCGKAAGQTIPHAHIHLIPRRNGDTDDPRGGVRGVIPGKMHY